MYDAHERKNDILIYNYGYIDDLFFDIYIDFLPGDLYFAFVVASFSYTFI